MSRLMNAGDTLLKTTYYIGSYEKEVVPGSATKEIHYIYGGDGLAAILKRQNGIDTMYYVHKELGSGYMPVLTAGAYKLINESAVSISFWVGAKYGRTFS
jgi:hypothetical protein